MNLSKMKRILFYIVIIFGISPIVLSAQNATTTTGKATSGIYMNSHDFKEGKLSYSFDCISPGKIKLNDFLSCKYVDVTVDSKKTKLNKDSIFGYVNCKNETYRFYKKHDEEFRILESKGIVIYSSYINVSSNNGKIHHLTLQYFFSKTEDSEILPLTVLNLKKAFPDNIKFHDMLDLEFGNGEPLSIYSASANTYKINLLLNQSNLK